MSLFRKQALDAVGDAADRGGILRIVPLHVAGFYLVLAALAAIGIGLLVEGRARVVARGRGVVLPSQGVVSLRAPVTGRVGRVVAGEGAPVHRGDALLVLEPSLDVVRAPADGTLEDTEIAEGTLVREGDRLGTLVPDRGELVAYMAVAERDRGGLDVGKTVRLQFDAETQSPIDGRVRRVRDGLLTAAWRERLRGIDRMPEGALILVEISLPRAASRDGRIRRGMVFAGETVLREQRLISLIFAPRDSR
ncbi:MAG: HlyD family efflux transporter periplasmic adaptor subunit [Deltaproteobacteria bacterium]|nr:HlyD family efflux transporter periplasmic adaptor subunit [Deltaproteobacteria bacterium]